MEGLSEVLALVAKGGGAYQVAMVWLLYQVWREQRFTNDALVRGQEQIKRAIVVSNPETARIFDEDPLKGAPARES